MIGNYHGDVCCPSFRVNIRNAPLTSCDLVMSRTCLSLSASVISFSVDNIPNESNTNIQGLRSSVGVFKYISVASKFLTKILNCYNIDNYDTGEVDSTTYEKRFVNSGTSVKI